jgi:hypothetical protein
MAKKTVSSSTILTFLSEESPVNWYSSGISKNCSCHAPKKKKEEDMKDDEENDVRGRVETDHVFVDVDEIVNRNEDYHPDEVRIN